MEIKTGAQTTYQIGYHFVWGVKYHKHLINNALRNFIAENVKGYGLKEASHFLRNIGKSDNQIAILDRHILRNLKALDIIEEEKIKKTI